VLWHGRKIADAVQRRNKLGLLIQGSGQPPLFSLTRTDWERAMLDSAPDAAWSELGHDAALQTRTEELALLKYSRADLSRQNRMKADYNRKR
jgi:hypothetical protein